MGKADLSAGENAGSGRSQETESEASRRPEEGNPVFDRTTGGASAEGASHPWQTFEQMLYWDRQYVQYERYMRNIFRLDYLRDEDNSFDEVKDYWIQREAEQYSFIQERITAYQKINQTIQHSPEELEQLIRERFKVPWVEKVRHLDDLSQEQRRAWVQNIPEIVKKSQTMGTPVTYLFLWTKLAFIQRQYAGYWGAEEADLLSSFCKTVRQEIAAIVPSADSEELDWPSAVAIARWQVPRWTEEQQKKFDALDETLDHFAVALAGVANRVPYFEDSGPRYAAPIARAAEARYRERFGDSFSSFNLPPHYTWAEHRNPSPPMTSSEEKQILAALTCFGDSCAAYDTKQQSLNRKKIKVLGVGLSVLLGAVIGGVVGFCSTAGFDGGAGVIAGGATGACSGCSAVTAGIAAGAGTGAILLGCCALLLNKIRELCRRIALFFRKASHPFPSGIHFEDTDKTEVTFDDLERVRWGVEAVAPEPTRYRSSLHIAGAAVVDRLKALTKAKGKLPHSKQWLQKQAELLPKMPQNRLWPRRTEEVQAEEAARWRETEEQRAAAWEFWMRPPVRQGFAAYHGIGTCYSSMLELSSKYFPADAKDITQDWPSRSSLPPGMMQLNNYKEEKRLILMSFEQECCQQINGLLAISDPSKLTAAYYTYIRWYKTEWRKIEHLNRNLSALLHPDKVRSASKDVQAQTQALLIEWQQEFEFVKRVGQNFTEQVRQLPSDVEDFSRLSIVHQAIRAVMTDRDALLKELQKKRDQSEKLRHCEAQPGDSSRVAAAAEPASSPIPIVGGGAAARRVEEVEEKKARLVHYELMLNQLTPLLGQKKSSETMRKLLEEIKFFSQEIKLLEKEVGVTQESVAADVCSSLSGALGSDVAESLGSQPGQGSLLSALVPGCAP